MLLCPPHSYTCCVPVHGHKYSSPPLALASFAPVLTSGAPSVQEDTLVSIKAEKSKTIELKAQLQNQLLQAEEKLQVPLCIS